jgi:hypothetical protein
MNRMIALMVFYMFHMSFSIINCEGSNRIYKPLHILPMQGGGWPSTTGNPSGGGRWNNEGDGGGWGDSSSDEDYYSEDD